ncbi:MAG: hypothetical protein R3E77_03035 [Steroidobacteraceae bacterium]
MSAKYYTHFVTDAGEVPQSNEWSGVVELTRPLKEGKKSTHELRSLLAESFDIDSDDIRILHWARLH